MYCPGLLAAYCTPQWRRLTRSSQVQPLPAGARGEQEAKHPVVVVIDAVAPLLLLRCMVHVAAPRRRPLAARPPGWLSPAAATAVAVEAVD